MPVEERPTSLRPHTSAYVRIRQHTSAYVSIRQHTSAYELMRGVGRNHQHDPHFYPPLEEDTSEDHGVLSLSLLGLVIV
jgi:hypothetical protein